MKKSTKISLFFALVSLIAGGIGVGISVKQFSSERLSEEITLQKSITSLTIEVDENSYFSYIHVNTNTNSDNILVKEETFIPHQAQTTFETSKNKGHLRLSNTQTRSSKFAVGVSFDERNYVTVNIPSQIKEIHFISKGDFHDTSTDFAGLTLDDLTLSLNSDQTGLSNIKAENITVDSQNGYLSLTDSAIYTKLHVTTDNAGINLNRNSLIQLADLQSNNGDIQILDSKIIKANINTQHGLTSLEKVIGQFEAISKDGDMYLIDRFGKSQTHLDTQNGNLFAILDKQKAKDIPLSLAGDIQHTFDEADILSDKQAEKAHHQLITKNGQISLLALAQTQDSFGEDYEGDSDYDEDAYVYYHIEGVKNVPASIISLNSEFYQDEQIIPFVD